ncbi:hypothetical protein D9C73_028110 [Collichthys lucidus]|uniref:Uncharacterized protein n=1 Tax=Collichthys lucidus TaxID=240159 RepID=A0A4U5TUL1_COLLU|nr:hypothetical protein D9C73_028110 [Collichthys lucidus]
MDFLKSLVPAVISGEGPIEHGGALPKDTGPRLLRMKRLGLLVMGQTIDEDPVDPMMEVDSSIGSSRPARNGARLKERKEQASVKEQELARKRRGRS